VTDRYDVIIAGIGAGGGTLPHPLAAAGERILILERGDFLTRETDNWNPGPARAVPAAPGRLRRDQARRPRTPTTTR